MKAKTRDDRDFPRAAPLDEPAGEDLSSYRLQLLQRVAEALGDVVYADMEVIVHDLRHPERSIVEIVNGHVSGRRKGQSIVDGLLDDQAFDVAVEDLTATSPNAIQVVKGYKTHTRDGRALSSSSVVLFDEQSRPAAALCVNVDSTAVQQMQQALGSLLSRPASDGPVVQDMGATVDGLVDEIVDGALAQFDAPVSRLSKQEKVAAVAVMHERGLFMLRGSAELVAKKLGTTKFTIYNYLEEIGKSRR